VFAARRALPADLTTNDQNLFGFTWTFSPRVPSIIVSAGIVARGLAVSIMRDGTGGSAATSLGVSMQGSTKDL
jgi:hypothetical protein